DRNAVALDGASVANAVEDGSVDGQEVDVPADGIDLEVHRPVGAGDEVGDVRHAVVAVQRRDLDPLPPEVGEEQAAAVRGRVNRAGVAGAADDAGALDAGGGGGRGGGLGPWAPCRGRG